MRVQHLLTEKNPNQKKQLDYLEAATTPSSSNGSPVVSKVEEVSLRAQALTVLTTGADSAASLGMAGGEVAHLKRERAWSTRGLAQAGGQREEGGHPEMVVDDLIW